jgi:hypothetical protein
LLQPQPVSFDELPIGHPFGTREAPAVARVFHTYSDEPGIASLLQADALHREVNVVIEPVHVVGLCASAQAIPPGGGPPAARPTVTVDTTALGNVATSAPQGVANGQRVAVLDTGDMNVSTMLDFLGGQPHQSIGDDIVGHGTAVADIVRALHSTAQVESLRVVNAQRSGSYELLCGLTYALWSDRYDAVNVSLSAQQTGGCVTVLGASLNMVMNICQKGAKQIPKLVAAAGNTTTSQAFGYPAKLAGAVIVQAWDWNKHSANYNVAINPPYQAVYASGGEKGRPLGKIVSASGAMEEMYGTSFAAAVATATVIP